MDYSALKKIEFELQTYDFTTGDVHEDAQTKALVQKLMNSSLVSQCIPENSFDETSLFKDMKMVFNFQMPDDNLYEDLLTFLF